MNIHKTVKPFKCSSCDKTFAQKGNCKTHERKVHNIHISTKPNPKGLALILSENIGDMSENLQSIYKHVSNDLKTDQHADENIINFMESIINKLENNDDLKLIENIKKEACEKEGLVDDKPNKVLKSMEENLNTVSVK